MLFAAIASLVIGVGTSIYNGIKNKEQAEEQEEMVEAQYEAKAAQAYNTGIQKIGDLQLGIASSGVRFNPSSGEAELDQAIQPPELSFEDKIRSGEYNMSNVEDWKTTTEDTRPKSSAPAGDTATRLMRQSRLSLAYDVNTIRETGEGVGASIQDQAEQDMYSNIFGTASQALSSGAQIYSSWLQTW